MLYKPQYCCNCGEKIERIEWNLLTSRRFCAVCFEEHKRHDYLIRSVVIGGALGLVFGLGAFLGGGRPSAEPVQTLSSSPALLRNASREQNLSGTTVKTATPNNQEQAVVDAQTQTGAAVPSSSPDSPAKRVNGTVHYCGALTKKGTPCSRKVKGPGLRCFQHEGKPAAPQQN